MNDIGELSESEENAANIASKENLDQFFSMLPVRLQREEWLNTWSHGLSAIFAIFGFAYVFFCALESGKAYALESALIYGTSLVVLFAASSFYHGASDPLIKKRLRIMDHCAIFIFIAGNYTPLLLLTVGGSTGFSLLLLQWTVAMIGVVLKIKFTGRFDLLFIFLFVIMAWIGVIQGDYMYTQLPIEGFNLLIFGGVIYMIGVVFYKSEGRIPYAHFIWHLFVMGGSLIHYIVMVNYVFS
ncbi:MAG: hemolysin III [Aureispira sp.]|jgi:hemolysin III